MPSFSTKSKAKLDTCHPDIQKVMNEVIKLYDFTVLYGTRTVEEQFELYKQGRTLKDGVWVKTGSTVTNLDGKLKKSMHNYTPSKAIDIAPYPIDWNNLKRFDELAQIVLKCAKELGIELVWGGSWKMADKPHFQLGA